MRNEPSGVARADRLHDMLGFCHCKFAAPRPSDDEIQKQLARETKPIGHNERQEVICNHDRIIAQARRQGKPFCLSLS